MTRKVVLAIAAVACVPGLALAGVAWDPASGFADNFSWANGENTTDAFGSPTSVGDSLLFFSNFDANAPGGPASVDDTMSVDFTANPGMEFAGLQLRVYGDYEITGQPGGNSVAANFGMTVTNLIGSHPGSPWSDSFAFGASDPTGGEAVAWDDMAGVLIDVNLGNVTSVHLVVDGQTIAIDDGMGGTASISANVSLLQIAVSVVPEPASLALLAMGGLALLRRR